ncbi:MAG: lmo0937 family membrane protein [Gemmatimonadaceae bacterium]|nr:lmo0937 family membrane protein [Gemmatimonadaceae bacterium]
MLWTIAVIIFILWLLGAFVMPIGGSLIHILLVVAIIVVLYRIITGRKPIP